MITITPWTQEEQATLSTLIGRGYGPAQIARMCLSNGWTRSENAIKLKASRIKSGKFYDPCPEAPDVFAGASVQPHNIYDIPRPDSYHPTSRNRDDAPDIVGVVGDLHLPFTIREYLSFCGDTFAKWNVTKVVFIGDVIDNHASSFHASDPNGLSAGDEWALARERLKDWTRAFPRATWILGNHDRIPMRKVFDAGLPREVLRANIYDTPPGWETTESLEVDGVLYVHGEAAGGANGAINLAKKREMSCAVGHYHRLMSVQYSPTHSYRHRFGLQVGCGFDSETYAAAYGKHFGRMAIGCGIVKHGREAYNVPMHQHG